MDYSQITLMMLCFVLTASALRKETHNIQLNSNVNEDIYKRPITIDAYIGDFLEMICPQYDTDTPEKDTQMPYIYDVGDKKSYDICNNTDKQRVFACDQPYWANKLTMKFQKFSPYPLGFTFQEGKTYYYIGIPKDHEKRSKRHPCENVIKLEVNIKKKKHTDVVVPEIKTISKLATTTRTTTTRKNYVKTTTPKKLFTTKKSTLRSPSSGQQKDGGGNGASNIHHVTLMTSLLALLTLYINI